MAEADVSLTKEENTDKTSPMQPNDGSPKNNGDTPEFLGLEAIDRALRLLYPNQSPVISSPIKKYWCEGPHPLDYIKVFYNTGYEGLGGSPHWHYVTYGFSDLHGDSRVHPFSGRGELSGYGFELTFRLTRPEYELQPPIWPVTLLNNLSHYVFSSGIRFTEYDHIPWSGPLDRPVSRNFRQPLVDPDCTSSCITNMVLIEDPKILVLDSPHGLVQFLQVLGIMKDEFRYARAWKTVSILDLLLDHPQVGPLMLTDMRRNTSALEQNPQLLIEIDQKIEMEGSMLGQVTSHVCWRETEEDTEEEMVEDMNRLAMADEEDQDEEKPKFHKVEQLFLDFDASAAELLHLMIKGRLKHGLDFIFRNIGCPGRYKRHIIEFVPYNASRELHPEVDDNTPASVNRKWNHVKIFCSKKLIEQMEKSFSVLENVTDVPGILPLFFGFAPPKLCMVFNIYHHLPAPHLKK